MKKLILFALLLAPVLPAQVAISYYFDAHTGTLRLPESIVGDLPPANGALGRVFVITNALNPGSCGAGGTSAALCRSNGTSWIALGGGAGNPITVAGTANQIAFAGAACTAGGSGTCTGSIVSSPTIPGHPTIEGVTSTGATGTGLLVFGTAPTLSAPVVSTITNTGTVTLPTNTGGLAEAFFCGATTGDQACANTSGGATARVIGGIATLASNSAVISGLSPAFTSVSTFSCVANDITTRANPVQVDNTSASSITITNTTGAADVISWMCVGS